ncbi:hypothetical protein CTAYLR_001117 [Chrysophaeum taylorii]|uniref:Serine aminopeptidase S33 domain-containing protein n=1 Tax=Chrysophaeum taylorii TaxID=2483200 RepID=A0AAD7UPN3_9STRA|nr:hypothetical protein CTAYLR_001117 [Chrysophaeum taylorii]
MGLSFLFTDYLVWRVAASVALVRVLRFLFEVADPKQRSIGFIKDKDQFNESRGAQSDHPVLGEGFVNRQGLRIFVRSWSPAEPPRGLVVLCHGFAEHSGRYQPVGERLARWGFRVVALDHQGHGRSEGLRGYVERFDHFVDDVLRLTDDDLPIFLLGHSMGGLIALLAACRRLERDEPLAGVLVSAPPVVPIPPNASLAAIARAISSLLPKLQLTVLPANDLCADAQIVHAYLNDPLVYRGGVRARLAAELISAMKRAREKLAASFPLPVYLAHGTRDTTVHPDGSTVWFRALAPDCTDKTFNLYDGLFHEFLFQTPVADKIIDDMALWMDQRCEEDEDEQDSPEGKARAD